MIPTPGELDLSSPTDLEYKSVDLEKDGFVLNPGDFVLGSTIERIKTDANLITFLDGRSTIARLGVTTHVTAGVIDGNHDNARTITLEIKNLGVHSIRFHKGDPIGLVMFAQLTEDIAQGSQSQYADQDGVAPPNLAFRAGVDR